MSLRIRRGTEAQRTGLGYTFDSGELIYTTDTKKLYIGDGITVGGTHVLASSAGPGLYWNQSTQQLEISGSNLTTAYVQEDPTNLYFTPERAQDAASILFTHGDGHSGISFIYDDVNNKIYATVTGGGSGTTLPGNAAGFLRNDGSGTLSWTSALTTVSQDTSPSLGGNLNLNSHNITGTGDVYITGGITASGDIDITGGITASGTIGNSMMNFSTNTLETNDNGLIINSSYKRILTLNGISIDGTRGKSPQVSINTARGTLTTPLSLEQSDIVGSYFFKAYDGAGEYNISGGITSTLSSDADVTKIWPGATLTFFTGNNTDVLFSSFTFDGSGVLNAPVFKISSYASCSFPNNPEKGWMIFDNTSNQFKGWNGTSWVVLG